MTAKHTSISPKNAPITKQSAISSSSKDKFSLIDQKIQRLKEKRERLHIQQALSFTKEATQILKGDFSPELVLTILEKTWIISSDTQKEEWHKHADSFRASIQNNDQKAQNPHSASKQDQFSEDHPNERS